MVTEIRLTTMAEVMELIAEQTYDTQIQRNRSSFLYRGMPNAKFHLVTSLQRNCLEKYATIEKSILRNFTKYAAIEATDIKDSVWRQLILGQHHGLPTRLLDWSCSPLIGLHFATSGEDVEKMDKHDGQIWKVDINEINSLLPEEYKKMLEKEDAYLFTDDMLKGESLKKYDKAMENHAMAFMEPPSIDQRIINQYALFSIVPSGITDIEAFFSEYTHHTVRYVIDKSIRWEVRDFLDRININERTVYPGLDGISAWLKRHYYVKKTNEND